MYDVNMNEYHGDTSIAKNNVAIAGANIIVSNVSISSSYLKILM